MSEINDFKKRKTIEHFREIIERINLCMFCTKLGVVPFASRPMATIQVDDECKLWFISNTTSHKNAQINNDNRVELLYSNLKESEFLSIHGTAKILVDEQKCIELWNATAEEWFTNGPTDPDISIIVVTPVFFHLWCQKKYSMLAVDPVPVTEPQAVSPNQQQVAVAA